MPPLVLTRRPRNIVYHQTHHTPDGKLVPLLPMLTQPKIHITHIIVAAVHLHDSKTQHVVHLNDHPPQDARFDGLWDQIRTLQDAGITILAMLGGAAKGSFKRLDTDEETFRMYYGHLRDFIRRYGFDGIDLDIEEPMSLAGVIRLIDQFKEDFGDTFIITMAPVAAALWSGQVIETYAEFSYEALEVMRGGKIAWYNTQFYCGWGDMKSPLHYEAVLARGFPISKIVVGLMTNPGNGAGHVPIDVVRAVISWLQQKYSDFGGIMGWEYFNALPGGIDRPWEWVNAMGGLLHSGPPSPAPPFPPQIPLGTKPSTSEVKSTVVNFDESSAEAPLPYIFDYYDSD